MSSHVATNDDQRLRNAWASQRTRVDAWELRSFPPLEWSEFQSFLADTASTIGLVAGSSPKPERDLVELVATYLVGEGSPPELPAVVPAGRAWSTLPQANLSGSFVDVLRRLHAYASIGTMLDDDLPRSPDQFVKRLEDDIQALGALLSCLPRVAPPSGHLNLQMVHDIALARFAIDESTRQAPAAGLAWLGGVSIKTIQNALSRDQISGGAGGADPGSARAWLADRPDWARSCWREAIEVIDAGFAAPFTEFDEQLEAKDQPVDDNEAVEWLFVPRAADESLFVPDLMRQRGWTIGPRGSERSFGDYWRALEHLQKTARPHWRRPNELGAYNIVVGRDWVRIARSELDLQLRAILKTGGRS